MLTGNTNYKDAKSTTKQKPLKKRLRFVFWGKKRKSNSLKSNNKQIEILDFEEKTKYEKKKPKLKFYIKNKFRFSIACLAIVVILLTGTSFITGKNVAVVGVKKVLNGLGIYTEEVRNVEMQSDDYNEPGSWHIDKSVKWTGSNTAQVTFDVQSIMKTGEHYKDVILVLDISGSMDGEKLENAISDSKELVSYLLSDSHNRVAIVTFESASNIVSEFSNKKEELLTKLDSITTTGCTNYNIALQNVDTVMEEYVKESNRDIVTLFLTDGYPNEETPNQVGTYEALKDKYPFMTINGVQYEMGIDVIEEIKQITDSQWVADQSTLNNVLFEASISPIIYEDFIVTDYIHDDYFKVNSVDDIKVTMGNVKLEEESGLQKITWNLGSNSFTTGGSAKMEISITLKEQFDVDSEKFYPTNKKEGITSRLPEGNEKTVNSSDTPVLKNNYEVIYDTNAPEGCALEPIDKEKYFVYQNVTKKATELSCNGYLFKGWEIDKKDENDIVKINDDVFRMPYHDVTIRATWAKQGIFKTMDGTVHEKTTLYKVLEDAAEKRTYAKEYTGEHQDSMDASKSTEKIYHWYSGNAFNKNNVVFAGQCWQVMRTTDTGGVKMIYNGEAEDGKCLNTRGTHVGYAPRTSTNLSYNYWYGTDYTYDATTKTFKVSGTTEQTAWNATTAPNLIGKYTCKTTTEDGTCSTLYLVESYEDSSYGYVIPLTSNSHYSQLGTLQFNADERSPAHVGYMYGDVYTHSTTNGTFQSSFTKTGYMLSSTSLNTSYWYADKIEVDSSTGKYSLVDPYQVGNTSEYSSLVGKYTFRSSSKTSTNSYVYYIAGVNNTTMYYNQLQNKNLLNAYSPIQFGDSITDNGDGTYTITNSKEVTLTDWYTDYANYKNQYTCGNSSTTCVSPRYTTATTSTNYTYINAGEKILVAKGRTGVTLTDTMLVRKDELIKNSINYSDYKYTCNTTSNVCTESTLRMITSYSTTGYYNYAPNRYYGSSVTWDGTNYTLVDPIEMENYNNLDNLSTHHYICTSYGEKKCASVRYVYHYEISGYLYYITLKNGVITPSKALDDMFTKNTTNSTVKNAIDAWYKKYLLGYDDYIEDTIFCNNRSIVTLGGWDPNGGALNVDLIFKEKDTRNDLSCINITDRFSVSNKQAKLMYKVGLMSTPEMNILSSSAMRMTGEYYWLISPDYFWSGGWSSSAHTRVVGCCDGNLKYNNADNSSGVRPAISLKPGTEYSDGDGSMESPYIVSM